MNPQPYEYKSSIPLFVFHFMFHQLQFVMCLFFSILNFDCFIRKVKQMHDKLWLVEHKVEHKKWYKGFVFQPYHPYPRTCQLSHSSLATCNLTLCPLKLSQCNTFLFPVIEEQNKSNFTQDARPYKLNILLIPFNIIDT